MTTQSSRLVIPREVKNRTRFAVRKTTRQLRTLHSAIIAINGTTQTFTPDITTEQQGHSRRDPTFKTHVLSR
jgi:hypothetical protein